MISNIPIKRLNESFKVYVNESAHNPHAFFHIENNNGYTITEFMSKDVHAFEALLMEVLKQGIKQGKQEVRFALGMKE